MAEDCDELRARSDMLHKEARLGLEKALEAGPTWPAFKEQIAIAERCEGMAEDADKRIENEC